MLVGQWGEGNGGEPPALQPVHCGCVHSNSLFCSDVRPILQNHTTRINQQKILYENRINLGNFREDRSTFR